MLPQRFFHVLSNTVFYEEEKLVRIDNAIDWLNAIRRRTKSERDWLLFYEIRTNVAFQSLIKWIKEKPFPWENAKGNLVEKLQQYVKNLEGTRGRICDFVDNFFPTTMAAWAICDRGTEHLPLPVIAVDHYALNRGWLTESARNYVSVSGRPAL